MKSKLIAALIFTSTLNFSHAAKIETIYLAGCFQHNTLIAVLERIHHPCPSINGPGTELTLSFNHRTHSHSNSQSHATFKTPDDHNCVITKIPFNE